VLAAGARLDVGVCRRIFCFVRRIYDDALGRRLQGLSDVGVTIATVAGRRDTACPDSDSIEITHMVLVRGVVLW